MIICGKMERENGKLYLHNTAIYVMGWSLLACNHIRLNNENCIIKISSVIFYSAFILKMIFV